MEKIDLFKPSNKTQAKIAISKYQTEIKNLQKLFGIDGMKTCSVCEVEKPIDQFKMKQSKCNDCNKEYFRNRYHERQKEAKAKKSQATQPTTQS